MNGCVGRCSPAAFQFLGNAILAKLLQGLGQLLISGAARMADTDDDIQQRIAMFEATIAAYVLDSLNPEQKPGLSYEAGKNTLLVLSHLGGEIPLVTGNALLSAIDPRGPNREVPAAIPHESDVVYDVVARAFLPHCTGDVLTYCQGLAASMQSFWPTLDPERLADKMRAATNYPDVVERTSKTVKV